VGAEDVIFGVVTTGSIMGSEGSEVSTGAVTVGVGSKDSAGAGSISGGLEFVTSVG